MGTDESRLEQWPIDVDLLSNKWHSTREAHLDRRQLGCYADVGCDDDDESRAQVRHCTSEPVRRVAVADCRRLFVAIAGFDYDSDCGLSVAPGLRPDIRHQI